MRGIFLCMMVTLIALVLAAKPAPHPPVGIVSDWTHNHLLLPDSQDPAVLARIKRDPRWMQNWYIRHPEAWWPEYHRWPGVPGKTSRRDWSEPLGTTTFEPLYDYTFEIGPDAGYGSLNTTDEGNGEFLATAGSLTVTSGSDVGTYSLYPGGPGQTTSPLGSFWYDDLLFTSYPSTNPPIDLDGLLFTAPGMEINIWGNGPGNYSFYSSNAYANYPTADANYDGTFDVTEGPGGGQTYPAKFVFDVTAAPSCSNDYVVIGIPANPASGGQANIVGFNNLYTSPGSTGYCPGSGPNVMFAYASGTGEVPAYVTISQDGTQLAYIENLLTGSSYFHVLTIGTTGTNGTSATAAVAPGSAGGNNAVDQRVLLSPDSGSTNQSSTNSVFVDYLNNIAYAATYSTAGSGSGYLYKIGNVFGSSSAPTLIWSAAIDAIPSAPVYDWTSNRIFFTDSSGRIDYVTGTSTSPAVVYGPILANGTTSENPVIIDGTNGMVYATFNSNGTNAVVVQTPTSMASSVITPVGTKTTTFAGPYDVDFNNAWYIGSGTPLLYVAGTGTGTLPTLYSVGFNASGVLNSSANTTTAALATGMADASPVTEFYNAALQRDFLFVGVTNHCIATTAGGQAGCVMALDITNGFPTVNASTTALPAAGGTTAIIVDNESSVTQASNIYYATKTGATLVKATQSGLD